MHSFRQAGPRASWPDQSIAESLLARLEGFQGYPKTSRGREVWIDALLMAVSEQHARAVIAVFDEKFPTLKRLRDVVNELRSKFEKPVDLIEKWKAEGAEYDPAWLPNAIREALAAKERKQTEERERLLKLGRPTEPKETEADVRLKHALETLEGGYDIADGDGV